jgi:protein phosphatase
VTIRWESAGRSDVGRVRRGNEDAFLLDPARGVFLVADGMGGHAAGEVASAIAREVVGKALADAVDEGCAEDALPSVLEQSVRATQAAIQQHASLHARARGMGTTLTACVLLADGALHMAHIGDSRAYRLRAGRLEQLSVDHTWVQREVEAGRLPRAAARAHSLSHIITRALSGDAAEAPDIIREAVLAGDLLLLCTDGLTGMLDDEAILRILSAAGSLPEMADTLLREANEAGGDDNITAVLVGIFRE